MGHGYWNGGGVVGATGSITPKWVRLNKSRFNSTTNYKGGHLVFQPNYLKQIIIDNGERYRLDTIILKENIIFDSFLCFFSHP